ncbi:MAG: hypothetical protein ISS71_03715 [Phycisphaerae bacterium]|nr:hypothetical protein [Phycisphaerae bacterium]
MIPNKKTSNSDVCFLVFARPADMLSVLARQVIPHQHPDTVFCNSVYDIFAALPGVAPDRPVILITRPSMLAKPHLTTALHQYPNLRLIGWLGPDEHLVDSPVPTLNGQAMVTVSTRDQLACVITAIRNAFREHALPDDLQAPEQDSKIEPADYRLSSEELDALLGAG